MDNHQMDTATQPTSWLERFFSVSQPGLVIVGLVIVALSVALGTIETSKPGREALQVVGGTLEWSIWSRAVLLVALWLFSTIVTHILAWFMRLRAPFPKALQATGKAWILYTLVLIVSDFVLITLVSVRLEVLAELWYISVGRTGGLLWVFFYPAAIKTIYGSHARSCLMTVVTLVIVLLLAGTSALLILAVFQ